MFLLKFIYRFIKFIFLEICSFFIKSLIFLIILVAIIATIVSKETPEMKKNTFLTINLDRKYNDTLIDENIPFFSKNKNFYNLIQKIKAAKSDPKVEGIILLTDNNNLSRTQIIELGSILRDFGKDKKLISYGTSMDNNTILISSYCKNKVMPPTTSTMVSVTAYNKTLPYYKNLINKLGVSYNVIHVGDYKSFGEDYVREHMSEERKSDLTRILNTNFDLFVNEISKNYNLSTEYLKNIILDGKIMGENSRTLKKLNLISNLEYFENYIKKNNIKNILNIDDYDVNKVKSKSKIALIYASGEIIYNEKSPKSDVISPDRLIPLLKKAEENNEIKGVVLRVNSPGGSALASNIIYDYIKNMKKPVYISVSDVAASGGYYIASAGKKIFANNESILGSIGVVSLIPNFSETAKKIGVNMDSLSLGKYSNLYSLTEPMSKENREHIYNKSVETYKEFLSCVSESRKIPIQELEKIAQGKVWLGSESKKIGLIDSIGSLEDTISALAKDNNIVSYSVEEMAYDIDFMESLNLKSKLLTTLFGESLINNLLTNESKKLYREELFFKSLTLYCE